MGIRDEPTWILYVVKIKWVKEREECIQVPTTTELTQYWDLVKGLSDNYSVWDLPEA